MQKRLKIARFSTQNSKRNSDNVAPQFYQLINYGHMDQRYLQTPAMVVGFVSKPVEKRIQNLKRTATLYNTNALSANQAGLNYKIFVANQQLLQEQGAFQTDQDTSKLWYSDSVLPKHFQHFVNPEVTEASPIEDFQYEQCLCLPVLTARVKRYNRISVQHMDPETGELKEQSFEGFASRLILHQIDHLNGFCMLDTKNCQGEAEILPQYADTLEGMKLQQQLELFRRFCEQLKKDQIAYQFYFVKTLLDYKQISDKDIIERVQNEYVPQELIQHQKVLDSIYAEIYRLVDVMSFANRLPKKRKKTIQIEKHK